MSLYAYCLGNGITERTLESVVGVAGVKPYVIEHEEIEVVVSDYSDESVAVTRENVFAHERVIDHVLTETTPLPFRFGTVVTRARLESHIHSQKDSLQVLLAR